MKRTVRRKGASIGKIKNSYYPFCRYSQYDNSHAMIISAKIHKNID
jgi:hypothetical protein